MIRKTPFFRLVLFLLLGICAAPALPECMPFILAGISLAGICFCSFFKKSFGYMMRHVHGLFLCLLIMSVGMYRTQAERVTPVAVEQFVTENVVAKIVNEPLEKNKTMAVDVKLFSRELPTEVWVQLYIKKDTLSRALQNGDWISLQTTVFCSRQRMDRNANQYKKKQLSGNYYVSSRQWHFVCHTSERGLLYYAHMAQKRLVKIFMDMNIKGDELSVLSALTIGDKSMLSKDLKNAYSSTGASHILAVSGLHVGVVFFVFSHLLRLLSGSKSTGRIRVVVSLLALWAFAFVTGLSPSVVRASIMLTMASLTLLLNRKSQIFNTVFASAFLMLLYSPDYLYDVGFQLSFSAVLSILLFQKPIYESFVVRNKLLDKIWTMSSVSFSAQLGTLPLSLYYFHQVSNLFGLSGLLVIPLSAIIIYLSIGVWCMNVVPYVGEGLAYVLQRVTMLMNSAIQAMGTWGTAVRSDIQFEWLDVLSVYCILIALWMFVHKQSFRTLFSFLFVVFLYAGYQTINKIFCNLAT